jgi:alkylation response protein AidB-like acyl-CoA dehydrogenase
MAPFQVLSEPLARKNWYEADAPFRALLDRLLPPHTRAWLEPELVRMGNLAPSYVEPRAAICDKQTPILRQYDRHGERSIDTCDYPPAYYEMERVAYGSGMVALKYEPEARKEHGASLQTAGFALGYLFAQAEAGLFCPVCMTDGVARVLDLYGPAPLAKKWIARLASRDWDNLATGAMFLTEKQGGSDVGATETRATAQADGSWRLYGEKWFCSNVDAEAVLVLARPDGACAGTRGLGLFLVPGEQPARKIWRLKEKLGVRSMPTGEVELDGAIGWAVGDPERGFKQMAIMLNLSRLYNALTSVALMRRGLWEATTYARARRSFGRSLLAHPLFRETIADLASEWLGALHLVFEAIRAFDSADGPRLGVPSPNAERDEKLVRVLTPLAKLHTAKLAVWAASESLEMLGGNGYIEEFPTARLLRDAQVLPVWEGTTNILTLDVLRACAKAGAHEPLLAMVDDPTLGPELATIALLDPDAAAAPSRRWMTRASYALEVSLLRRAGGVTCELAARRLEERHGMRPPGTTITATELEALLPQA